MPQRLVLFLIIMALNSSFAQLSTLWNQSCDQFDDSTGEFVIETTAKDGYIVIGTYKDGSSYKHILLRTEAAGEITWTKKFEEYIHHWDCSAQPTSDGGYILCGGGTDGWLKKCDRFGDEIWTRVYGDENYQFGRYAIQTGDGGFAFIGGYSPGPVGSRSDCKIWLIKTNATGEMQWSNTYGGLGFDMGTSLLQTENKGYLITGTTCLGGDYDYAFTLIKTDSSGVVQWLKNWRPSGYSCRPEETIQTEDNGSITVGTASWGDTEESFVYIVKSTASGDTLWTKMHKKGVSSRGSSIKGGLDGGYVVAATAAEKFKVNIFGRKLPDSKDAWIFKLNSKGDIEWEQLIGGPFNDTINHLHKNSDGSFIFTGYYGTDEGNYKIWLVKLSADGNVIIHTSIPPLMGFNLSHNYPNPFNPTTTIEYTVPRNAYVEINILDLLGRNVRKLVAEKKVAGTHEIKWDGRDDTGVLVSSGVYLYNMSSEALRITRKLSLLR